MTHDLVQHPEVLPQVDRAVIGGRPVARIVEPGLQARAVLRRAHIHARLEGMGKRLQLDPLHFEAQWGVSGRVLQDRRPGAIRQHPAKKLGIEAQALVAHLLLILEPRRFQQPAREFTRTGDGVALATGLHLQHGRLQRHDAAGAHPMEGRDFARRRLELPMDHAGESRQGEISLRRGRRQKIDIGDVQTGPVDGVSHRQRRHLGVGEQRPLVTVDRIVPRLDAILFEHSLPDAGHFAPDFPEEVLHRFVVNGRPGQELSERRDVGSHGRLPIADSWSNAVGELDRTPRRRPLRESRERSPV